MALAKRLTLAAAAQLVLSLVLHVELALAYPPWTEMFVKYNGSNTVGNQTGPYLANDPDRQHLHYALPPGGSASDSFPVFFFAHGNGGTAAGMPNIQIGTVLQQGFALVSWESVTTIQSENTTLAAIDVSVAMADLDLVCDWVKANGAAKGLSTSNWTISGRSRGSVISFPKAYSNLPEIKSAYFYNALPSNGSDIPEQIALINRDSPPVYLAYGPKCPEPIQIEGPSKCISYKTSGFGIDIHNPISGQRIVNRYEELGKGNQVGFTQGMETATPPISNIFVYLANLTEIVANNPEPEGPGQTPATPPSEPQEESSAAVIHISYMVIPLLVFTF